MVVLIPPATATHQKPDLNLWKECRDAPLPKVSLGIKTQRPSQRLLRIQPSALKHLLYRLEVRVRALPPGHTAIGIRGRCEGLNVQRLRYSSVEQG